MKHKCYIQKLLTIHITLGWILWLKSYHRACAVQSPWLVSVPPVLSVLAWVPPAGPRKGSMCTHVPFRIRTQSANTIEHPGLSHIPKPCRITAFIQHVYCNGVLWEIPITKTLRNFVSHSHRWLWCRRCFKSTAEGRRKATAQQCAACPWWHICYDKVRYDSEGCSRDVCLWCNDSSNGWMRIVVGGFRQLCAFQCFRGHRAWLSWFRI